MTTFLLAGLATCGACNAPLATTTTPQRRYVCAVGEKPACAMVAHAADPTEELIREAVQQVLDYHGIVPAERYWQTTTIDRQREVIALLVESVVLGPSRTGDPDRLDPAAVEIAWKG
jgi:hypothetical protein